MYKQFFVHPGDADWQRILWRFHPDEPITEYRLLTVTYGTSSAPYLAVRCLLHLVEKHNDTHPNAFEVIRRLRYVDDLFAGADSSQLLLSIKDKLVKLISLAQLHLGKWSSKDPKIIKNTADSNDEKPIEKKKDFIFVRILSKVSFSKVSFN